MPGNEWALVAGLPLPSAPLSQQEKPFSKRGRAVTRKEWTVVREKERKKEAKQVLLTERD